MNSIRRPIDGLDVRAPAAIAAVDMAGIAVIVALFAVVYQPTFAKLVEYWTNNDMYSYGFLIPIISVILLWSLREQLAGATAAPSWGSGLVVLSAGLLMLVVGRVSSTNLVEELSIPITLCGLTLLLFGPRVFRIALFPLAYLFAMVPIWDVFTSRLHPIFQLYSARVGVAMVHAIGIPALREGVMIVLPNVTLEVAQACSGINYLIAVLCTGYPLTHMLIKRWPKRLMILGASAVIAVLTNAIRVAIVCVFAYHELRGPDGDIHGPFALFRSLMISVIGFAVLFGLVLRFADRNDDAGSHQGETNINQRLPRMNGAAVMLAVIVLASCVTFLHVRRATAVPLKNGFAWVPPRVGGWTSRLGSFPSDLDSVSFDDHLSRNYQASDGAELNLFIGYFQNQEQGKELAGYSLRTALASDQSKKYTIDAGSRVNDLSRLDGQQMYHLTYWYVVAGRIVADDPRAKLYTAWNGLAHGRTNGSIVVVKTAIDRDESLETARKRERDFVEALLAASVPHLDE
jgi:EpsI family protein